MKKSLSRRTRIPLLPGIIAFAVLSMGCSGPRMPVGMRPAFLFANYQAPLLFNTKMDSDAVSLDDLQSGRSHSFNVTFPYTGTLSSIALGDGRLYQAARKANIDQIVYADYTHIKYLTVFNLLEFRVYGVANENTVSP